MLDHDQTTQAQANPSDIVHFHRARRTNDDGLTMHVGIPEGCVLCEAAKMRRFVFEGQQSRTDTGAKEAMYGIEWQPGGPCELYARTEQTTSQYASIEVMRQAQGNGRVVYLD